MTVFTFDITSRRSLLPLARNAVKKLRTLRHPGVIKFLESYEVSSLKAVESADGRPRR